MTAQAVCEVIREEKLIAIVRGVPADRVVDTVRALLAGGIRLVELTLDQTSPESVRRSCGSLRQVREALGDAAVLGAGTVLSREQAEAAMRAGAEYLISPNLDPAVIQAAKEWDRVSIPGALTPTEAAAAYRAGADFVKLFPAGLFGTAYLKAVRAPLNQVPFLVVGNVSLQNLRSFLDAGATGVGVGGELVDKAAVAAGDYESLTGTARAYVRLIKE